ncbi:MAG: acyl-CoA dehydrogenase [SAR324 cluster bacterium]|nr:acyl-CoA dehydrogenase [SAR324 cluster bacterium]
MTTEKKPLTDWIGSKETREDIIGLSHALSADATFNQTIESLHEGDVLPPLWHWFYFLPQVPSSKISQDGHPERGGFLPPVELPRRMFAGGRLKFHSPLIIGKPARREGEVLKVTEKSGSSGQLVFVTVQYQVYQAGELCIEEEQDIVYKEAGGKVPAPIPVDQMPELPSGSWSQTIVPNQVLLFRFSALTFNAHRIHYDRPYAMNEEGYPGLVVHGPLTAVMLAEFAQRNSKKTLSGFSFRGRAPLFDMHPFRLIGTLEEGKVNLQTQGPDGKTSMTATAEL